MAGQREEVWENRLLLSPRVSGSRLTAVNQSSLGEEEYGFLVYR